MEHRNKTLKRPTSATASADAKTDTVEIKQEEGKVELDSASDPFRNLLDESAREAFRRPWHRLERGLRLNRLRMYVEEMSAQCSFTTEEKGRFFVFLQNALDRKLLNTHKIVEYVPELQKIRSIKGLEVRRTPNGEAKWGFVKAKKADGTRRVRRQTAAGDKVEEAPPSATQ
jgi:hypothetical protein